MHVNGYVKIQKTTLELQINDVALALEQQISKSTNISFHSLKSVRCRKRLQLSSQRHKSKTELQQGLCVYVFVCAHTCVFVFVLIGFTCCTPSAPH